MKTPKEVFKDIENIGATKIKGIVVDGLEIIKGGKAKSTPVTFNYRKEKLIYFKEDIDALRKKWLK